MTKQATATTNLVSVQASDESNTDATIAFATMVGSITQAADSQVDRLAKTSQHAGDVSTIITSRVHDAADKALDDIETAATGMTIEVNVASKTNSLHAKMTKLANAIVNGALDAAEDHLDLVSECINAPLKDAHNRLQMATKLAAIRSVGVALPVVDAVVNGIDEAHIRRASENAAKLQKLAELADSLNMNRAPHEGVVKVVGKTTTWTKR